MSASQNVAADTAQAIDQALQDYRDGVPAGQSVLDAHAALDRAEAAGVTAADVRPYRRR